jgi:hypothetical protein
MAIPISELCSRVESGRGLTLAEQERVVAALRRSLEREAEHKRFYIASANRHHRIFDAVRRALGDHYGYDLPADVARVVSLADRRIEMFS